MCVCVTCYTGATGAPDVCVIELGGTVGDIESMPFIEALRQFQFKVRVCVCVCVCSHALAPNTRARVAQLDASVHVRAFCL